MELIKTVTVMRHGTRTPIRDVRKLSGQTRPCGSQRQYHFPGLSRPGHLTARGFRLCRGMGRWMRDTSGKTVPKHLTRTNMHMLANDTPRTIDSAKAFALGLTGRHFTSVSPDGELFTPRLISVDKALQENAEGQATEALHLSSIAEIPDMLSSELSLLHRIIGTEEKADPGETHLILCEGSGPRLTGRLNAAASLADTLISCHLHDPGFLDSLTEHEWKQLARICDTQRSVLFGNEIIVRNALAPFFRRLSEEIAREDGRFTLLSGHDSTMKAVLTAIGAEPFELMNSSFGEIPAGSCLNFEIYSQGQGKRAALIRFIYPTDDQILGRSPLGRKQPPAYQSICLRGIKPSEGGYYRAEDVIEILR